MQKPQLTPKKLPAWKWHLLVMAVGLGGFAAGFISHHWAPDSIWSISPAGHSVDRTGVHKLRTQLMSLENKLKAHISKHNEGHTGHAARRPAGNTIHTLLPTGKGAYQEYQTRIFYASYKLIQKQPESGHHTGFTRILYSQYPDVLMDEVPTFLAMPISSLSEESNNYAPINRPCAIQRFIEEADKNSSLIKGAWMLVLDVDYVWMKPMQVPGDAYDPSVPGEQFFYDYLNPDQFAPQMEKMYTGLAEDIPHSGASPALLRYKDFRVVMPDYLKFSVQIEKDPELKEKLGWTREMYAWNVAIAHHKDIKMRTEKPPNSTLLVQIPFDTGLGNACLCHYTWGATYRVSADQTSQIVYRWDKRDFHSPNVSLKLEPIPLPPPYKDGLWLQFNERLTKPRHDLVVLMLEQINKAIATLPDLTEHRAKMKLETKRLRRRMHMKLKGV